MNISDELFVGLIEKALTELPERYIKGLDNVAIIYADEPTSEQRRLMGLRGDSTLLGLYEGVPLPARGAGYNLTLPDVITLFKYPHQHKVSDEAELFEQIKHTLWHEIAHFYGLDHDRIDTLESRSDT